MTSQPPGLWPVPGEGVLARYEGLILLCSLESGQFADVLLDLLEDIGGGGADGRRFADAVADALEIEAISADNPQGPSVIAFGPAGTGLAVTVSGAAWVDVVTANGTQRIECGQPGMLMRSLLRAPVTAVRGGLGPSDDGEASIDRFSRLDGGTVRAGGLAYYPGTGAQRRAAGRPGQHAAAAEAAVAEAAVAEAAVGEAAVGEAAVAETVGPEPAGPAMAAEPAPAADSQADAASGRAAGAGWAGDGQAGAVADGREAPTVGEQAGAAAEQQAADEASGEVIPGPAANGVRAAEQAAEFQAADQGDAGTGLPGGQPPPVDAVPGDQAGGRPAGPTPTQVYEPWQPVDQPVQQAPEPAGYQMQDQPGGAPPGRDMPAERWPTAAVLVPGSAQPQGNQGTALTEEPPPLVPDVGGADLAGREATIAPSGEPFEAVLLSAPGGSDLGVAARAPLPKAKDLPPGTSSYAEGVIIQGVYCKNGHFDDPEALFCAVCGISMNQQTLVPRPGPRPPLGVLLLDDGSVFQLDKDYVVGREPSLDSTVAAGRSRPLRITDESGIVSRVHARVHLDGWRVLVTDLGSANGTRVTLPRQNAEQALLPQVPIVLAPGSQVDLGGRVFRYESHRGR